MKQCVLFLLFLNLILGCETAQKETEQTEIGQTQYQQKEYGQENLRLEIVAEPTTVEGMANAVQYGPLLFGAQPSQEALKQLAEQGYKTVLNTRDPQEMNWDEAAAAQALGMTYINIPMTKPVTDITDGQVEQFHKAVRWSDRPMVLHCGSGNRVSGLWAVWLVEHEGKTPEEALQIAEATGMRGIRPVVEKRLGLTE